MDWNDETMLMRCKQVSVCVVESDEKGQKKKNCCGDKNEKKEE